MIQKHNINGAQSQKKVQWPGHVIVSFVYGPTISTLSMVFSPNPTLREIGIPDRYNIRSLY